MWANLAIYIGDLKKYKIVYMDEKPIMYQGCIIATTFSHGYMSHLIKKITIKIDICPI